MKNNIKDANKITLNCIQRELKINVKKSDFLKMIFPESIKNADYDSLLDFMFSSDSSYQSSRTSFFNGNIYKKNSTYSRAHQSELNFIAKQLNTTSSFNDMIQLISKNFNIPINHNVFSLIKLDEEIYPSEFKLALNSCKSKNEPHKLLMLMILWSVYGEWITLISLNENNLYLCDNKKYNDDTLKYFRQFTAGMNKIKSIDFAFQSGAQWITNTSRAEMLANLINNKIKLNIIIADNSPAKNISNHIHHSEKFFSSVNKMWSIFQNQYPEYVNIKVSSVPLMHNYYCFNMKEYSESNMRINFYTYHNAHIDKNYIQIFTPESKYYILFKDEFNYLWNKARNIN